MDRQNRIKRSALRLRKIYEVFLLCEGEEEGEREKKKREIYGDRKKERESIKRERKKDIERERER